MFTKIALSFYYTGMLLIAVSAVAMLIDILTITGRMHRNRTQSANAAASA